ncbi:uncharacterized protein LOC125659589 [Ostrea edulis]|uniref:uncharacterized protein LOC125659589 n=1 Tax=Ostrea edulis TaxID=37623 RepID=UPI0024AE98B8|nr:uncharacterized protein LOC125659589 [Ostrea edulis]
MPSIIFLVLVFSWNGFETGYAEGIHDLFVQLLENNSIEVQESLEGQKQTDMTTARECLESVGLSNMCFRIKDSAYQFCLVKDTLADVQAYAGTLQTFVGDVFCSACCSVVEKDRNLCILRLCRDGLKC